MASGGRLGAVALGAVMLATGSLIPATASDGECETSRPDRAPVHEGPTSDVWADGQGVAIGGASDDPALYTHVDLEEGAVEGRASTDNSVQYKVDADGNRCVRFGAFHTGGAPEFEVGEPAEIVPLPWLRQEGRHWVAEDGRTTILYGVDYLYNRPGINPRSHNLTTADFERIRSWGMNLLRIRLRASRSGWDPGAEPEAGFLENLDHVIAEANRHGIYVIIATGGPEGATHAWEGNSFTPGHEQLKFIAGTPQHEAWLDHLESIWRRYTDWPGVVGFDAINEDLSYPIGVHDRLFMGPGHEAALRVLRQRIGDDRHVYFQQPSGWGYWNFPGTVGHDLGDANRHFCFKWGANNAQGAEVDHDARMDEMERQANEEAGAPLFICEWVLYSNANNSENQMLAIQRQAMEAMDAHLVGGARNLYGDSDLHGLLNPDGTERFWLRELIRPYPVWVGGAVTSIDWDFDARRLQLGLELDGSGDTEIFVPRTRSYAEGFTATTSTGETLTVDSNGVATGTGLQWNEDGQRLVLPLSTHTSTARSGGLRPRRVETTFASTGPVALTVQPLPASVGSDGWLSPGSNAADTAAGDGDGFQIDPHLAHADGGGRAENLDGAGDLHEWSMFALPEDFTGASGVEVRLDWWSDATLYDPYLEVQLSSDGGTTWSTPRVTARGDVLGRTDVLGAPDDTWGLTWTSDADPVVRVRSMCMEPSLCTGRDYFLDWVSLRATP